VKPAVPPTRFIADAMLARLARWLRALGHDTLYDPSLDDRALVDRANREDRILLTRDRHLLRDLRPRRAVEITHDAPLDQLAAVAGELALPAPNDLFRRCLVCNTPLDDVPPSEAAELVPPAARARARLPVARGEARRRPRPGRRSIDQPLRRGHGIWPASRTAPRVRITVKQHS
jgi:uncharacterized protein with PIN domain